MRISIDETKKREAQVEKIIASDPGITDQGIIAKMKTLTGRGVGSRLVRRARSKYEKAHAKFSDKKSVPMNGAHGPQVSAMSVRAKPTPAKKPPASVVHQPTILSLEKAKEMMKPVLRNLQKIMEACPALPTVGMKRIGGKVVPFGDEIATKPFTIEL